MALRNNPLGVLGVLARGKKRGLTQSLAERGRAAKDAKRTKSELSQTRRVYDSERYLPFV
jgi:hypothetical protein